jgi:segregation and condensation protein B
MLHRRSRHYERKKRRMLPDNKLEAEHTDISRDIEALLFASDEPLSLRRLSSLTGISSTGFLKRHIESLNRFYHAQGRSFEIIEVAGGYQMTTLPEFAGIIAQLFKSKRKARLSKPALETLAIIAYKQPISRIAMEQIRGVNCDGVLATLLDRELIEITGRGEGMGKPFLYATTKKFLEYLGLKDHRDLPSMDELERNLELADQIPQRLVPEAEQASEQDEITGDVTTSSEERGTGHSGNE